MSDTSADQASVVDQDRVVHDEEHHRYILLRGDQELGEEVYDLRPGVIRFLHTEVPDIGERGLGAKLVAGALADVRARGELKLVPVCPYVKNFVTKNEEWQDLLAAPLDEQ